ncbi:MAG: acetyltransferase [Bacteroidales bacterium]|nr:acetyltransferase [Bacteroidales bacterium]
MTEIIIIGAGGHAAEIDEYIKHSKKVTGELRFKVIGFLDDNQDNYNRYNFSAPLLGNVKDHTVIKGMSYIVGIAGLDYRRPIVEKFMAAGGMFATIIHSNAYISESAYIGKGSIIGPNANIGPNVRIGNFTLINARCSIGHDTIIGDFNIVSPNVCLSGFTLVGDDNLFGINSASIPGIRIGSRNKIAAGMILDQKVGDDSVVFYRFKERVIAIPRQYD